MTRGGAFIREHWALVWLCAASAAAAACSDEAQRPETNAPQQKADAASKPPPGPPPEELRFEFHAVTLEGAGDATDFAFLPGKPELLVTTHPGKVLHFRMLEDGTVEKLSGVQLPNVHLEAGCGLLSLSLDPEFDHNGFVYLAYCEDLATNRLTRHRFSGDAAALLEETADILTVRHEPGDEYWHRFGSTGFEPDGETMWALLGDLFVRELAQELSTPAGALLRFRPNREPGGSGLTPATDNPFADSPDKSALIYAYGLRSPWKGYRDRHGRFWIGDVGEYRIEEINLVSQPGQNFGWGIWEGPCELTCDGLRDPLIHWGRDSDEPFVLEDPNTEPATKRTAWLGLMYEQVERDRYYDLLDDWVLYGDFYTGWVRGVRVDMDGAIVEDKLLGHLPAITAWRIGPDGYLYALTLDGRLHRAVAAQP